MDQRIAIGTGILPSRPVHRACVVAGCWCRSTPTGASTTASTVARSAGRSIRVLARPATSLTAIALRSVGLPVV